MLECRVLPAVFVVTSTVDDVDLNPGDGMVATASGGVTLRAAIQEANALPGEDTIQLPDGTYSLSITGSDDVCKLGDLDVNSELIITGNLTAKTIINFGDADRIFDVLGGASLKLSNLTIEHGAVTGSSEYGGGIRNLGILTIENVAINHCSTQAGGGAIANAFGGVLTMKNCDLTMNTASGSDGGGALFVEGSATVTGSEFNLNASSTVGGAISVIGLSSNLILTESVVTNNDASMTGLGGGLFNAATVQIQRSTFHNNDALRGGAIYSDGNGMASLTLTNSTLSTNHAWDSGAGLHCGSSSFESVTVTDSTIVLNVAEVAGGGLVGSVTTTLSGTIVALNDGKVSDDDFAGSFSSLGYNLVQASGTLTKTDIVGVDPLIDVLGAYGGLTPTHRLLVGSPAIDRGNPNDPLTIDQRGFVRPIDSNGDGVARADIGAVETLVMSITNPNSDDVTITLNSGNLEVIDNHTNTVIESEPFDPSGFFDYTGVSGDDKITVDFTNGNPITSGGFSIDGGGSGSSGNEFNLTGMSFVGIDYGLLTAPAGEIDLNDGANTSTLGFNDFATINDDLGVTNRSFTLRSSAEAVTIGDDGDTGNKLSQLRVTGGETINFSNPNTSVTVSGAGGNDVFSIGNLDPAFVASATVRGDDGDDMLTVSNTQIGFTLAGGNDRDTLTGGTRNDTLLGDAGNDSLLGGDGDDVLLGGSQVDSLFGGAGNDLIRGQGGSKDSLRGGLGDDTLDGGGNDFLFEEGDVNFTLSDTQMTGVGTDKLIGLVEATLTTGASANLINLTGFSGYTAIFAGSGNDTVLGGSGSSYVIGDEGNDSLVGNGGNDTLVGAAGRDTLVGGDGNDALRGLGGSGDQLTGGAGNDTLDGGAGADRILETGDVNFVLTNGQLTGLGTDTLLGIEEAVLYGGAGANRLDASAFTGRVDLYGNDGNDTLIGGAGNDGLYGGAGNDVLSGGASNDTLKGGTGNDALQGGLGVDSLLGEAGTDTLTGGTGNGTSQGDAFPDATTGEIDEFFTLSL